MEPWKKIVLWGVSIGAGIAFALALVIGGVIWWSKRPPKPPVWSETAITAKNTTLTLRNWQNEIHVDFQYALTNHTNNPYSLPPVESGSLMRRMPEDKSLDKFDNATWDSSLVIPPNQTFNVKFAVVYKLSDYDTTSDELEKYGPGEDRSKEVPEALAKFMNKRMSEIDGLVFFDYSNHYRIELPRNWELKKTK